MAAPIYATSAELIAYPGMANVTPAKADEKLRLASRLIDSVLIGAVYPTDSSQIATDTETKEAIRDATIAQAAFWLSGAGSEYGGSQYDNVSIGSVTLSGSGKGNERGTLLAQQAFYELSTVGLIPVNART
jgi:hypothetical protein